MKIMEWLTQPNRQYETGVDLFRKFGKDDFLLSLFEKGENRFTSSRLYKELNRIYTGFQEAPPVERKRIFPVINPNLLPVELKRQHEEKGRKYALLNHLRAQLRQAETKESRYAIARKILELSTQIKAIWNELDRFQATGEYNKKRKIEFNTIGEVFKRLELVKNYLVKHRKSGNTSKIKKYEQEKADLERRLNEKTI